MQESSDLYKVIADEATMGFLVFSLGENESCVYCNRLGKDILDIDPSQDISQLKIEDFITPRSRPEFRSFSPELLQLEGLMRDVLMQKISGVPLVVNLGIKKVNLQGSPHVLLMLQDITIQKKLQREIDLKQTEIKEAYQELLEQNKQLKELDLAKDRFIALTTHELRTPVSAIYATAEVLNLGLFDTDAERDEFVKTIFDQAGHILELVNDILDFAKIQAGKMDFFIEEQDLRGCLDLQITNFQQMAAQKNIQLNYEVSEGPLLCYFDNVRLGEVFSNVINNAIKFSNENSEVKVVVKKEVSESYLVSVIDQGKGIPADKVDKVFNEFETVGNINTHQKGTGLGMPISKRIMDSMGGSIQLKSVEGQGTTFFIRIPTDRNLDESEYKTRPEQVDDLLDTV